VKKLVSFAELINKNAKKLFNKKSNRLPSIFIQDRIFAEKLFENKDYEDMLIALDCFVK
jgi:hypothetical protein